MDASQPCFGSRRARGCFRFKAHEAGDGQTSWNDLPWLYANVPLVIDNLTSTATDAALSAAQGKELKTAVDRKLELLPQTLIYIVATNGNDTTGDGSEAKPFASIAGAASRIPMFFPGNVAIRVKAGTYTVSEPIDQWGGALRGAAIYAHIRHLSITAYSGVMDVVFNAGADMNCFMSVGSETSKFLLSHIKFTNTSNRKVNSVLNLEIVKASVMHSVFDGVTGTSDDAEASAIVIKNGTLFMHSVVFSGNNKIGTYVVTNSVCTAFNCSGTASKYGYCLEFGYLLKAGSNITGGTANELNKSGQIITSW